MPVSRDSADVTLLYSPLPSDLPAFIINKDELILMAAYEGNVDRYVRLRRPYFLDKEVACIVRGIYHNTSFASWWVREVEVNTRSDGYGNLCDVKSAIAARFIMNNDVDYALGMDPGSLPYMFRYPHRPHRHDAAQCSRPRSQPWPAACSRRCIAARLRGPLRRAQGRGHAAPVPDGAGEAQRQPPTPTTARFVADPARVRGRVATLCRRGPTSARST